MKSTLLLLLAACQADPTTAPAPETDGSTTTTPTVPVTTPTEPTTTSGPAIEGVTVTDVAIDAGFQDPIRDGKLERGRACVVADFDNDGRQDLFLTNPMDDHSYVRNVSTPGHLAFAKGVVVESGTLVWSAAAADYDNDGDMDVFGGGGGNEGVEYNRLWQNQFAQTGETRFVDVAFEAGVAGPRDPKGDIVKATAGGSQWADFDQDGWPDIYVSTNLYPQFLVNKIHEGDWIGRDLLFHNNHDGTFTEIAAQAGLVHNAKAGRHSSMLDFDNDGDMDVFQNNFGNENYLYRSGFAESGELTFQDVTRQMSYGDEDLHYPFETFASASADANQDGWLDLFVEERGWAAKGPYISGHALFINLGGTGYVEISDESGLNAAFLSGFRDHAGYGAMGMNFGDFTGDGIPDVYVANGGPEAGRPDTFMVATGIEEREVDGYGPLKIPIFADWSELVNFPAPEVDGVSYPPYPYRGHGVCTADFDGDGVRDVIAMKGGTYQWGGDAASEPDRVFQFTFDTPRSWVTLRLHGDGVNVSRDAIGTRVAAQVSDGTRSWTVYDAVQAENGFSGKRGFDMLLGLGTATAITGATITWPNGQEEPLGPIPLATVQDVTYGEPPDIHE